MSVSLQQLYADQAAYQLPIYTLRQASRLVGLSLKKIEQWPVKVSKEAWHPGQARFSFLELVELHMTAALLHNQRLSLPKMLQALPSLQRHLGTEFPLASQQFVPIGLPLLIEEGHLLAVVSPQAREALTELAAAYEQRIKRDTTGFPTKLYPLYRLVVKTAADVKKAPTVIAVDPLRAFGRPMLADSGVTVEVVVSRYRSGDSIRSLVDDYEVPAAAVEEALRYELGMAA